VLSSTCTCFCRRVHEPCLVGMVWVDALAAQCSLPDGPGLIDDRLEVEWGCWAPRHDRGL